MRTKHPSLDITIGDNGECVLVKCWAGCETDAVLDALGMTMRDLFASDGACAPTRTRKILSSTEKKPTLKVMPKSLSILDPSKLPGAPETLPKGWGANDWDCPDGVNALEALIRGSRAVVRGARDRPRNKRGAHRGHAPPKRRVPGRCKGLGRVVARPQKATWTVQLRILFIIADSPEWAAAYSVALRIAVVAGYQGIARFARYGGGDPWTVR